MVVRHPHRLPLLALGMLALLTGLWAGLARLGWAVPLPRSGFSSLHGPLMVSGFLGTLISLERAVALGRPWAYAAPLLTGLGGVGLIVGAPLLAAQWLMLAGSLGLVAIFAAIIRRHPALYTFTMGGGSLEPISKSFEEHRDAGELHKSEKIGRVVLPANEESAFPLEPGKEPFHEPAALVPA